MHAYLILAHKQDKTLQTLIKILDDESNAIFVHLDKKAGKIRSEFFNVSKSKLHLIPRINVEWGAFSIVQAELNLLKAARSHGTYEFYHLLSGEDLPLKSQAQIHAFFSEHETQEFISFKDEFDYDYRVNAYYPIQRKLRRNEWGRRINSVFYKVQKKLGLKRNQGLVFKSGSQWFSITDDCARYVIAREKWLYKVFHQSFCSDEVFLQTLIYNSPFKDRLYHSDFRNALIEPYFTKNEEDCMRLIDWNRGDPYTFEVDNMALLKQSPFLFARKFDAERSAPVIKALIQELIPKI